MLKEIKDAFLLDQVSGGMKKSSKSKNKKPKRRSFNDVAAGLTDGADSSTKVKKSSGMKKFRKSSKSKSK